MLNLKFDVELFCCAHSVVEDLVERVSGSWPPFAVVTQDGAGLPDACSCNFLAISWPEGPSEREVGQMENRDVCLLSSSFQSEKYIFSHNVYEQTLSNIYNMVSYFIQVIGHLANIMVYVQTSQICYICLFLNLTLNRKKKSLINVKEQGLTMYLCFCCFYFFPIIKVVSFIRNKHNYEPYKVSKIGPYEITCASNIDPLNRIMLSLFT